MKPRFFLKPLSMVLAALASHSASAATSSEIAPMTPALEPETSGAAPVDAALAPIAPNTERTVSFRQDGNLFNFVLARAESGELVAYHSSHASHESHSSHSSHQSHFSGS